MPALPILTPRQAEQVLPQDGWYLHHSSGGHNQYRHRRKPGQVTIPWHHRDLSRRELRYIIGQAGLTTEELTTLLLGQ